jgi:hypothetical protein
MFYNIADNADQFSHLWHFLNYIFSTKKTEKHDANYPKNGVADIYLPVVSRHKVGPIEHYQFCLINVTYKVLQ